MMPWRPMICAPVGKSGPFTNCHQVVGRGFGMVEQVHRRVDHFAEVVRRDVGGHADGDALAAVDEQVGEPARQHDRHLGTRPSSCRCSRRCSRRCRRACASRAPTTGTRCNATPPGRSRASRSCRGRRSADGAARSPAPCARARRRSRLRRAGGTCPSRRRSTRAHFMWLRSGRAFRSYMPQRIRRCTGFRPSRASGSARCVMTDME